MKYYKRNLMGGEEIPELGMQRVRGIWLR